MPILCQFVFTEPVEPRLNWNKVFAQPEAITLFLVVIPRYPWSLPADGLVSVLPTASPHKQCSNVDLVSSRGRDAGSSERLPEEVERSPLVLCLERPQVHLVVQWPGMT